MADIDIVKETIEFEEPLDEIENSTVLRGEHLIPDTHPDVDSILSVEAIPKITSKETVGDKVHLEGKVDYNLLYVSREEAEEVLNSVIYNEDFSCSIELPSSEHRIYFDTDCGIEHIQSEIINERKIKISGVLKAKCIPFKNESFEFVKDIGGQNRIEMLKEEEVINKVLGRKEVELEGKSTLPISMDKPQVGKVLNCSTMLHKKEVKLSEDKVYVCCFCKVNLLYRGIESNEVVALEDDIFLSNEEEFVGVTADMKGSADIELLDNRFEVLEDDLGEYRKIDLKLAARGKVKIILNEEVDLIKDAYSPEREMDMKCENKNLVYLLGDSNQEVVVKENILIDDDDRLPNEIIYSSGKVEITDSKIQDGRISIEGYTKVVVIYKSAGENKKICSVEKEIPFVSVMEMKNLNDDMKMLSKAWLENIQSDIEGKSLAVKAIISVSCKAFGKIKKSFITSLEELDTEKKKKASLTIYVMQKDDSLWGLAKKYNTTIGDICKINNIEDTDNMSGKKLIIPGRLVI